MKLNNQELLEQLRIQVKFLSKSSIDFDNGDHESAIEISTNIRTLFHDTSESTSLLQQLEKKNIRVLNTSDGIFKFNNKIPQYSLVTTILNPTVGIHYYPFLDKSIISEYISFEEWWNDIVVYVPQQNLNIRRKDLVLKLANNYHAHIGTNIPKYYHDLFKAKDNMIGFTWHSNSNKINHLQTPLFPSIRQISHELIVSLREEFRETLDFDELYFDKLDPNPTRIAGVSQVSFGFQTKSEAFKKHETLPENVKNKPVQISEHFLKELHNMYEGYTIEIPHLKKLLEELKPYQLSETDLLEYCRNFKPFLSSYKKDIQTKIKSEFKIDIIHIIRTSVCMNNDDYFMDIDPTHEGKVLRNKYNRLIKKPYNEGL